MAVHLRERGEHTFSRSINRTAGSQVLFGEPDGFDLRVVVPPGSARLPDPYRVLPELIDLTAIEDDTPSCGLTQALERQELFVNQAVATPALSILWEFFRHGRLTWHGAFVNLRTGSMRPQLVKDAAPVPEAAEAEELRVRVMA